MAEQKPQSITPWKFYVLYASVPRGWNPMEQFQIEGQGWKATFRESGPLTPFVRMKGDETLDIKTNQHPGPCVEIVVDTDEMDFDKVMTIGRPTADIVAGLLVHRLSTDIINSKLWSGLMGTRADSSTFLVMGGKFRSWEGAPIDKLKERAAEVTVFDPSKLSSVRAIIPVAYRWLLKGLLGTDRNDRFISIWLSAVALYTSWCESHKQSYSNWCKKQQETKDTERNKMRYYIQDKLGLSGNEENAFFMVLSDSYDLRNKLIHESKIDIIRDVHINWLAKAVGSMLWIEMGFPIGGSPAILISNYLE
jgi:hypothetical protein